MATLTLFFDWLLAASARASLLTVVVLLAQAALRHRLSARWRYALWLPVLVVLLTPVFPESEWSVSAIIHVAAPPSPKPLIIQQQFGNKRGASPVAASAETSAPIPWQRIVGLTWVVGTAGILLCGIADFAKSLWRFKQSRVSPSDALQQQLAALAKEMSLRRVPRLWVASAVSTPAVTGLFRPTLLLPADFEHTLSASEARHVLRHEFTHIKRGDLPIHALLCLLLALHWFNPLLWLAFFKARLDREAACDAQVLDREDQTQRVAYGHTLLKVETAFSPHGLSLGFVGIFQRGAALRSRIQSIASLPKPHPLMKTAVALAIILLTFLGITKAAAPDPNAPLIYISSKFVEISEKNPGSMAKNPLPLPAPLDVGKKVPGVLGILNNSQFEVLIRDMSQRKGVDLMTAPSLTAKSGQQAKVEIVREFIYPATKISDGTPAQPITVNPGVSLTVLPKIMEDGYQIALDLSSQVVEFEGFAAPKGTAKHSVASRKVMHVNGSATEYATDEDNGFVRVSKFNSRGELQSSKSVPLKPLEEPVFNERKAKADVVIDCGNTVVLELDPRIDEQLVQETDGKGRVVSSSTDIFKRRLFVFITANLISPVTK